jgi:hypothetical protein
MKTKNKKKKQKCKISKDLPSLGAGGLRVAQLVRMALVPSHCPFIPAMAFSASYDQSRSANRQKQVNEKPKLKNVGKIEIMF